MWQQPIYDRTLFDVQTKSAKAYINTADLNRIEGNIQHMANELQRCAELSAELDARMDTLRDLVQSENNI